MPRNIQIFIPKSSKWNTSLVSLLLPLTSESDFTSMDSQVGSYYSGIPECHAYLPGIGFFYIFGTINNKGDYRKMDERIFLKDAINIINRGAEYFSEKTWGSFFAIIFNESKAEVTAYLSPFADFDMLFYNSKSYFIFASSIELFGSQRRQLYLNWDFVSHVLVKGRLPTDITGISGVRQLLGGYEAKLTAIGVELGKIWDPMVFTTTQNLSDNNVEERTIGLLQSVVQTMLPTTGSIGILLSGGFDSSLVTGLLAAYKNDHNLLLINSRANDSWVSDERHYARVVADMIKVPLIEHKYNLDRSVALDINEIHCTHRPVDTVLALEFYRALDAIASDIDVHTFFTGHGGDQLFLSLLTHHFIFDYIRDIGFNRNVISYFISYLSNSRKSIGAVFLDALKDFVFQPKTLIGRRVQRHNRYLLNINVVEGYDKECSVLEEVSVKRIGYAKAWQLLGLFDCDSFSSPLEVANYRFAHPFCSQVLWEYFLSIPSYILLDGGVSRGFIRRASSTIIPPIVTHRFSKGGGGPLMQNHAKHKFNQEFLRSGILVAMNYVDLEALEKAFAQADQPKAYNRICDLLSVEIWLQNLISFLNGG